MHLKNLPIGFSAHTPDIDGEESMNHTPWSTQAIGDTME
nr:hypothetical protein [Kibdelosporangium sp. MJ126-NF4]CTQ96721.1 hypothetical protein [Kibdelosporangium sp. MJ126-NF4]